MSFRAASWGILLLLDREQASCFHLFPYINTDFQITNIFIYLSCVICCSSASYSSDRHDERGRNHRFTLGKKANKNISQIVKQFC